MIHDRKIFQISCQVDNSNPSQADQAKTKTKAFKIINSDS